MMIKGLLFLRVSYQSVVRRNAKGAKTPARENACFHFSCELFPNNHQTIIKQSSPPNNNNSLLIMSSSSGFSVNQLLSKFSQFKSSAKTIQQSKQLFMRHQFKSSFSAPPTLHNHGLNHTFVALCGRSNVGKSSLMNALFNNKKSVKTSKTPGRTQLLNFFTVGNKKKNDGSSGDHDGGALNSNSGATSSSDHGSVHSDASALFYMVDMPGYGYAKAPISVVRGWQQVNQQFLKEQTPSMVYWLLDSRRDQPKEADIKFGKFLVANRIPFSIVYTKVDKPRESMQALQVSVQKLVRSELRKLAQRSQIVEKSYLNNLEILETSSRKKSGIDEMRFHILATIGIAKVANENGQWVIKRTKPVSPLPEAPKQTIVEEETPKSERNGSETIVVDSVSDQPEDDVDSKKEKVATPTMMPRTQKKKKSKAKLRIGELIKKSKTANKDIQRTRFLDDKVNRTKTQYNSYQRIHKYQATKHKHGKPSKPF